MESRTLNLLKKIEITCFFLTQIDIGIDQMQYSSSRLNNVL